MIVEVEAQVAVKWLETASKTEADVQRAVAAVLSKRGLLSLSALAEKEPSTVVELAEAMQTMIRMAPVLEDE